jgi:hypothetical protein
LSVLRTVLAGTEMIAELRESKSASGLAMIRRMLSNALPVRRH